MLLSDIRLNLPSNRPRASPDPSTPRLRFSPPPWGAAALGPATQRKHGPYGALETG